MKRGYSLTLRDIFMIELSDIFGTMGVIGLFLFFSRLNTITFLEQGKWVLLLISILFGIIPLRKILKEDQELTEKKIGQKKDDTKKSAKRSSKKVKKVKKKSKKGAKK